MSTEATLIAGIVGLWGVLSTFVGVVLKTIWAENRELKTKLDLSNQASRDLIAIQAEILRGKGVKIVTASSPDP